MYKAGLIASLWNYTLHQLPNEADNKIEQIVFSVSEKDFAWHSYKRFHKAF